MTERLEEIVNFKSRALTAQAQRLADDAERLTHDMHGVRAEHRGAVASFESVRRRLRERSESADPRRGRFDVEALRARLLVERGAVQKIEERLADGELRISRVQREIATAIARMKRLQELGTELRAKEVEGRELRVEEALRELWLAGERGTGDPVFGGDRCVTAWLGKSGGETGRLVEPQLQDGAGVERARPVEGIVDIPPPGGRTLGGWGAGGGDLTQEIGECSMGGAKGHFARPTVGASVNIGALERVGGGASQGATFSPLSMGVRSETNWVLTEGRGAVVEQGGERGVSLTYQGAAGSAIAVAIDRRVNGALKVEFQAERPSERYRLERERRGLLDALRGRGYEVERLIIRGGEGGSREDERR